MSQIILVAALPTLPLAAGATSWPLLPQDPIPPTAFRFSDWVAAVATVRSGLEKSDHKVLQGC